MRSRRLLGLTLLATFLLSSAASATTTRFFRQTTVKDFEEGEATATSVSPPGEVLPGMKSTRVAIDASFAWCATLARDRATGFFGTGDRGRIFAIEMGTLEGFPNPPATLRSRQSQLAPHALGASGVARQVAELDVPWVTALAARADGNLLAGSTPGGQIFAVDTKSGKHRLFAKLAAEHVWALAHDPAKGVTYAATGDSGKIFTIDAKGSASLLWDSGDKHVMSLALDGGNLFAGTADKAILYRVGSDGKALALHDFDADEVRAIVRGKGATYLAVNDFDNPADANPPPSAGAQPAKGTRINPGPAPASGAIARAEAVKARAAVYRLDDGGGIEQLFALADGYFTALVLDGAGNLFAASGSQGKLYRIAPDRTVSLAADVPERQALALVQLGAGFLVGTGDVGAVYRVSPAAGAESTYLGKVLDAEAPAQWGRVWWSGSRDLVVETRSGNTGKPDAGWSGFERVDSVVAHNGEHAGRVRSPSARYLQYRATLPTRDSVLKDISIYYLPNNQRARVTEVNLGDAPAAVSPTPGASLPATGALSGLARTHASTLKLRWKVENPDGDELIYKLWFRREGDGIWRSLGGPDPLAKPEYDWNTDSVSDGRYVIRVWTSDEKVTPAGKALDHLFESPPLLVDNSKPEVLGLALRGDAVTGRARDAASVISAIEYAVDGGDWRPVEVADGVLDERDEGFTVHIPKSLTPGPHIVNLRAWDSADNVGAARIEVTTPAR